MLSETKNTKNRKQTYRFCKSNKNDFRNNNSAIRNSITGTIQPLPQYGKTATFIVTPAKTTVRDKKIVINVPNTADIPYTIRPNTKFAELQIRKSSEMKTIRPVNVAALNLLDKHNDVVTYVNALK